MFYLKGIASWVKEKMQKLLKCQIVYTEDHCQNIVWKKKQLILCCINNVLFKFMIHYYARKYNFVNTFSSNLNCRISAWNIASSSNVVLDRCGISVGVISNCGKELSCLCSKCNKGLHFCWNEYVIFFSVFILITRPSKPPLFPSSNSLQGDGFTGPWPPGFETPALPLWLLEGPQGWPGRV